MSLSNPTYREMKAAGKFCNSCGQPLRTSKNNNDYCPCYFLRSKKDKEDKEARIAYEDSLPQTSYEDLKKELPF